MRIKTGLLLLSAALLLASCEKTEENQGNGKKIEVTIGSGPRLDVSSQTRTTIGSDGVSIGWASTDKISLWAEDAQSVMQLSATTFGLKYYNTTFNSASFTSWIDAMAAGTYTYYATYPVPASISGTQASYNLPATQDGSFNGNYDVMVATPVTAAALQEGDNSKNLTLQFTHKVHVLRISLPKNTTGQKITSIQLTFPVAVTGTLTVDAKNPTVAPVLTNGSNTLTLNFATPKDAGDTVYAMIAPVELTSDQNITMIAYGDAFKTVTSTISGKNFQSGHTTPIAYNVPAVSKWYTRMRITLANTGETTLGEKINTFQLSVSGAVFDNSQATRSFTVTGTGIYEMLYEVDNTSDYQTTMKTFTDNLSGKTITVSYDSNDALVTNTFTMPTLTPFASNNIGSISVPYLMAQDFSSLSSFSNHDAAETGGLTIDTNTSGFTLDSYNVAGWSAARAGGESGKCIRICCRTEHGGIGEASRYHGRADSAPLAGIKSGKQVKIAVSFDYGGGYGGYDFGASVAYGYTTTTGAINSTSGGSWGISNPVQFTPYSYDGSYSTTPDHYSYTLSNCTSAYRLSWEIMTTGNKFTKNANHWLYIDNIKVSISK